MESTERARADRMTRRRFMRWMAAGALLPSMAGLAAACAPATQPGPTAAPKAEAKPTEAAKPAAKPTDAPAAKPDAKPVASPQAAPAAQAAKPAEKPADLDQIVDAAKKEGEVHWADVAVLQFNDPKFHDAFKKKYGLPDSFQVRHTLKGTGDLVTQVQQEVQANKVTIDFLWIGDITLFKGLEKANALLEYVPSGMSAIEPTNKKLGFPTGSSLYWTIVSYAFAPTWNKKFWDKPVKTWMDTVDPALKDQAIQGDIRTSSTQTDTYIGLRKAMGNADYFKAFAELNPILVFRTAEQQQKLNSGERVLTNFNIPGRSLQAVRQDPSLSLGAAFPTDGVVPLPILAGIMKAAAHPNAAKLWAEFITSQEGQQIWLDHEVQWPLRTDVKYSDELKPFVVPLDEIKAVTLDWDAIGTKEREDARNEFKQIFNVT